MNYWEMQKSFWKTPTGIIIWITLLAIMLGGGLLALNFIDSPFPVIEFFHARPMVISQGETTNLSWSVIGASMVDIYPRIGHVEPKGFRKVSPSETIIYTLIAMNGSKKRSIDARVIVE